MTPGGGGVSRGEGWGATWWAVVLVASAMIVYHLASTQYLFHGTVEHQDFHLGFALLVIFLARMRRARRLLPRLWLGLLGALSVGVTAYIKANYEHLEQAVGFPEPMDAVVGVVLVVLVLEATRLAWGPTLSLMALLAIAYFFLGYLAPQPFTAAEFSRGTVISYLGIGLSGIFGTFLGISADYVFLFVVFGAVLEGTRIHQLFLELGKLAGRFLAGGPAQTAVVSSSLLGMVTGAAVANVTITGAYTIPFMKRVGLRPESAAAVEAAASEGSQIIPPIMGAAAFLMAALAGTPYTTIMLAAIVPAFLFAVGVAVAVHIMSAKQGIRAPTERVDWGLVLRRSSLFILPMGLIVYLLMARYSPGNAAFYAILAALGLSFVLAETRPGPVALARTAVSGAESGASIALALATVGMIAQAVITTGFATRLAGVVESLSGGSLLVALLLTMLLSLQLGVGLPVVADYGLVAIVVAPALVQMGVEKLAVHFFIFYFAIFSGITPPVALSALAASRIADGGYWRTGLEAFRLVMPGFVIPFLIVYDPATFLSPSGFLSGWAAIGAAVLGMVFLTALFYRHLAGPSAVWELALFAATAAAFLTFAFNREPVVLGLGVVLAAASFRAGGLRRAGARAPCSTEEPP